MLADAALGLSVAETARKQFKSAETVKTQRKAIMLKLGARNTAHAVAMTTARLASDTRRAAGAMTRMIRAAAALRSMRRRYPA